jgi:hypothetical protein
VKIGANQQISCDSKIYSAPSDFSAIRLKVNNLLRIEIGRAWRDFGRHLTFTESELDEIEEKYPKDLKSRITMILELGEQRFERKDFGHYLCRALSDIRRNDLRKKIERISQ